MFNVRRNTKNTRPLYNITDGYHSVKMGIQDTLEIVKNSGFPFTLKHVTSGQYLLTVYCPNDILEFSLRK